MPDSASHLRRLDGWKRTEAPAGDLLGETMIQLYHRQVEKRQTKLAVIADVWCRVIPEPMLARCALESYYRGRLTVIVDSAPHLYELKQLLLAGLEAQLLFACRGAGLRRIALKRGRWYDDRGEARF